jgi:hypothetical protein
VRHRARWRAGLLAVVVVSLGGGDTVAPSPSYRGVSPRNPANPAESKLILLEQSPIPADAVPGARARLDDLPFDGIVISVGASSEIQRQTPLGLEELRRQLAPIRDVSFTRLRRNFVIVYATPAGAFSSYQPTVIANFADLAQAAREAGLRGIFFDNEEYFGPAWAPDVACSGAELAACRVAAQQTAESVMQAMIERWPTIEFMTSSGPWLSEPQTAEHLAGMGYNDIAHANEVWGSFAVGLLEGSAGTAAAYIDGGGIYTQRSVADLEIAYDWFRYGLPEHSDIVPPGLKQAYEDEIEIAFGLYDFPVEYRGKQSDATVWGQDIADAVTVTDRYVWAYSERYNWTNNPENPDKPTVPEEYLRATRAARAAAGMTEAGCDGGAGHADTGEAT